MATLGEVGLVDKFPEKASVLRFCFVPGQLLNGLPGMKSAPTPPLLLLEPAEYRVSEQQTYFRVEAKLPFQVLVAGDASAPLFTRPVHLEKQRVESAAPGGAQLVTVSNRAALLGQGAGSGVLHFSYRVPIENHEGPKRAEFPLLAAPSAQCANRFRSLGRCQLEWDGLGKNLRGRAHHLQGRSRRRRIARNRMA